MGVREYQICWDEDPKMSQLNREVEAETRWFYRLLEIVHQNDFSGVDCSKVGLNIVYIIIIEQFLYRRWIDERTKRAKETSVKPALVFAQRSVIFHPNGSFNRRSLEKHTRRVLYTSPFLSPQLNTGRRCRVLLELENKFESVQMVRDGRCVR